MPRLLLEEIAPHKERVDRMVASYLPGFGVSKRVFDAAPGLSLSSTPTDTGVVTSWFSASVEHKPFLHAAAYSVVKVSALPNSLCRGCSFVAYYAYDLHIHVSHVSCTSAPVLESRHLPAAWPLTPLPPPPTPPVVCSSCVPVVFTDSSCPHLRWCVCVWRRRMWYEKTTAPCW